MDIYRIHAIMKKTCLSAILIALFGYARPVFSINESPEHYDALYGMPSERIEQRVYLGDGWHVNATFDGGKATAVQYMKIVTINDECLPPADLEDPDIDVVLARHDPASLGWQKTSSGDDLKWLRNDRRAIAYLDRKWMMTVINLDNPPHWYAPSGDDQDHRKQENDRGMDRPSFDYSDHYKQLVQPILDEYGIRKHEIQAMAKSVIELKLNICFEELTFVNIDIYKMPDDRDQVSVTYVIDDSEIIESSGDKTVRRYDTISVNFYPDAGLAADRAYISRGTRSSSVRR